MLSPLTFSLSPFTERDGNLVPTYIGRHERCVSYDAPVDEDQATHTELNHTRKAVPVREVGCAWLLNLASGYLTHSHSIFSSNKISSLGGPRHQVRLKQIEQKLLILCAYKKR